MNRECDVVVGESYEWPEGRLLMRVVGSKARPLASDGQILVLGKRQAREGDWVVAMINGVGLIISRLLTIEGDLFAFGPLEGEPARAGVLAQRADVQDIRPVVGILFE